MTEAILDGKKIAAEIAEELKQEISARKTHPRLSIILVGDNPESKLYTSMKLKKCMEIGVQGTLHHLPETGSEEEIINVIRQVNDQSDGVMIQIPLPSHLNTEKILNAINPDKDVDGLTAMSLGKIMRGDESCAPATPQAIVELLNRYGIPVQGKEVTIINHSALIGKPLALMLLNRGATVTVCHEFTSDLKKHTLAADILITAVGKARFIKEEMVKEHAVVVDAGICKTENGVVGDVDFERVALKASCITPVPGGVGPMTVVMLLKNVVQRMKTS